MSESTRTEDSMNQAMRESLSALMDGEASEIELHRILSRVEDDEVRAAWSAMHRNRDAMQGTAMIPGIDISLAVRQSIVDIRVSMPSRDAGTGGLRRSLVSFAVAASVTAVVVLGGQQFLTPSGDPLPTATGSPGPVGASGAIPVRASLGSRPEQPAVMLQPASASGYQELARQRLRKYSQAHAEQAALNTPQGLVPFARVQEIQPQ